MRSPGRIVGTVTAVHGLVNVAIATAITGPLLAIDDLAYLAMGRTLAGGGAAPMSAQPPYGVLYPTLLAPGWLVGLDESQMIVFAQIVNSVLGALLLPVLYVLVRRLTDSSFGWALGAATIGASMPAALLTGGIVWTERLLPLLVALAVLALLRLRDEPTTRRAVEATLVAVAMYAAHPRMIVVAAVVTAAAMWITAPRRERAPLVVGWMVSHAGIAAAELVRRAAATATFGTEATYDGTDLASRRGLSDLPEMVLRGGGTLAYLVLATAGLAVLGVAVLAQRREMAVVYAAMVGATVTVAGWFLAGVNRADAYLHGRYIEVMAPLLVALGVIGASRLPWRLSARLVATGAIVAGLYGAWAGPGDNWARPRTPVMMLGTEISGAPFGGDVFQPGAVASMAVLAGLAVVLAARTNAWLPPLVVAGFVAVGVWSGVDAIESLQEGSVAGRVQAALADLEIQQVAIDTDRLPSNLTGAVAWQVGLDNASSDIGIDASHLLLPPEAVAPRGAIIVAEFGEATLWELPAR